MDNISASRRQNCLNLIRIIAVLQVVLGHMLWHLQLPGNEDVLHIAYFLRGVPIFFAISGFLMWFSIERTSTYSQYLKKRFWRIYPELWGAVFIEVIPIFILYNGWDIKSILLFVLGQGTLFQFWTPGSLRGYGVGVPNGALWTIGVIVQFYIIAWFVYKIMKKQRASTWMIGFFVTLGISWLGTFVLQNVVKIEIISKLFDETVIKFFWIFYVGLYIAKFQDVILPVLKKYWFLLLTIAFIFFWTEWDLYAGYYVGWSLFLVAGLIGFAYRFPSLSVSPDISYGGFLYHMIIVNIFVTFGLTGIWIYVFPIIAITGFMAYLSTISIGKISGIKRDKISQVK